MLGALALAFNWLHMDGKQAVTISFLTLAFIRLWHVFNMRYSDSPLIGNDVVKNPFVWGALRVCTALLLLAVFVTYLASVLKLVDPGLWGWGLIRRSCALFIFLRSDSIVSICCNIHRQEAFQKCVSRIPLPIYLPATKFSGLLRIKASMFLTVVSSIRSIASRVKKAE